MEIEEPVKMLFGYAFEREEFVNAGVVYQYVESAKCLLRLGEEAFDVRLFRYVGLHCNGLPAFGCDFSDDCVSARLAGSVVDDHGRARFSQVLGDKRRQCPLTRP